MKLHQTYRVQLLIKELENRGYSLKDLTFITGSLHAELYLYFKGGNKILDYFMFPENNIAEKRSSGIIPLFIKNLIEKICSSYVDRITFFEKEYLSFFYNKHKLVSEEKLLHFPWIVDTTRFNSDKYDRKKERTRLGLKEGNVACLYYGGFMKFHGVEYIIQSIPKVIEENKNIIFIIIGPENKRYRFKNWEKIIGEYKRNVQILDEVPRKEITSYLAACDICLSSFQNKSATDVPNSRTVLYEMMSMGKPIVTCDLWPPGLVEDMKNGIIVPPASPEKISEGILLLAENEKFREKLGRNARIKILKYHSPQYLREEYTDYFLSQCDFIK